MLASVGGIFNPAYELAQSAATTPKCTLAFVASIVHTTNVAVTL